MSADLHTVFPLTSPHLPKTLHSDLPETIPFTLKQHPELYPETPFLADLATIELAAYTLKNAPIRRVEPLHEAIIQPSLDLIFVTWQGIPEWMNNHEKLPVPGNGLVLIFPSSKRPQPTILTPSSNDLLALNIVAEKKSAREAAEEGKVSIGYIDRILRCAEQKGLLQLPQSGQPGGNAKAE